MMMVDMVWCLGKRMVFASCMIGRSYCCCRDKEGERHCREIEEIGSSKRFQRDGS